MNSFDTAILIRTMRQENPGEDIYIERINRKNLVLKPEDKVRDVCGYIIISTKNRDIAINPKCIITIFSKGDL